MQARSHNVVRVASSAKLLLGNARSSLPANDLNTRVNATVLDTGHHCG